MRDAFLLHGARGLFALASLVGLGCSTTGGSSTTAGAANCPSGLTEVTNEAFCAADPTTTDCSLVTPAYKDQVCGVPVKPPAIELARSPGVMEFAGSGPPQLACLSPSGYPAKADPSKHLSATVSGVAKIFSSGCASTNLSIQIYTVTRTGGANDGSPGALVGTGTMTPADCTTSGVTVTNAMCTPRYECKYSYPGVPVETELLIKTSGAGWAALYDYNFFIRASDVKAGAYGHDVRALASDDYGNIAQTAIGGSITPGHGAVAGEVHDCGDVRLQNAVVDLSVDRRALVYFDSIEAQPLPDPSGQATEALGLWAGIDVLPGPVTVAAAGLSGGKLVGLGYFRMQVFPDSVSTVTFSGLPPYNVP